MKRFIARNIETAVLAIHVAAIAVCLLISASLVVGVIDSFTRLPRVPCHDTL